MTYPLIDPLGTFTYGDGALRDDAPRSGHEGMSLKLSLPGGDDTVATPKIRPRRVTGDARDTDSNDLQQSIIERFSVVQSAVEDAIDDNRERDTAPSQTACDATTASHLTGLEPIMAAISDAKNRADAVVAMVDNFAKAMPGVSVRCGFGKAKLRRMYDSRLGWLGSESSLFRDLAERWKEFIGKEATSEFSETQIIVRLRRPKEDTLALLSLTGLSMNPITLERLRPHESLIGSILLGRPRIATPQWSATAARSRMAITIAVTMVLILMACPVPYRTSCVVRVEPINSRSISAPFEATIETVLVEPGSNVTQGQPLVTLDGRPLRLEQQSIDAEIQQTAKMRDVAMAAGKIAEGQLALLKGQQLSRQRMLLQRRLEQLTIASPIDGVIVSGDLRRSIGAPLETGQVLFEIASLDRVMVEVEIPEREICMVMDDSTLQLRVDSSRAGTVDTALRQIYPAAQLRDDQSVFIAPLELDNRTHLYRPGMKGKATVYGPVRPWAWTHVRGVFDQVSWLLGM